MLNQCNFIGNLTADPELKFTQSGHAVCNFTIAVNSGWGDNKRTEFVRVVCWRKTAEACSEYLKKGKKAFVSGEMQTRKWQDNNGNDRYTTEIVATDVQFLTPRDEGGSSGGYNSGPSGGGEYNSPGGDVPF
jgi:single-strand DNA-binding protein